MPAAQSLQLRDSLCLPSLRVPIETLPHLLPWGVLHRNLLPFAPPQFLRLFAGFARYIADEGPRYSGRLRAWERLICSEAWDQLDADERADWAALEARQPALEHADGRRHQVSKQVEQLERRIVERWLRIYAIRGVRKYCFEYFADTTSYPAHQIEYYHTDWSLALPPPPEELSVEGAPFETLLSGILRKVFGVSFDKINFPLPQSLDDDACEAYREVFGVPLSSAFPPSLSVLRPTSTSPARTSRGLVTPSPTALGAHPDLGHVAVLRSCGKGEKSSGRANDAEWTATGVQTARPHARQRIVQSGFRGAPSSGSDMDEDGDSSATSEWGSPEDASPVGLIGVVKSCFTPV